MLRILSALAITTLALASPSAHAQVSAFELNLHRIPTSTLVVFHKSNLDGTNPADISVYIRDSTHLESFKPWHDPTTRATLVTAQMDWRRFSVRAFNAFELNCDQLPQPRATLESGEHDLRISLMKDPVPLTHLPWHSYDFDFASLGLAMPMLKNPLEPFTFTRMDFEFEPTMRFREMGEITVRYQARELHNGRATRRYSIGGPGLRDTVGTWWADTATGTLVEYEIPIGDEPGYDSVRLTLKSFTRMTAAEWETHKQRTLCGPPPDHKGGTSP